MSRQDCDRVFFRTFAAGMLKHLEDEGIVLFNLPHLIKQIHRWCSRSICSSPTDRARDVRRNAICKRLLYVMGKILQTTQLENIKRRFYFVGGMSRRIQPGMTYIITQRQDERFAPLTYYLRFKRITTQLGHKM